MSRNDEIRYWNQHQYAQPGGLLPGFGYAHPHNHAHYDVHERNKEEHDPPCRSASDLAHQVDIRKYNIIYKMLEDIELALQGLLEPKFEPKIIGVDANADR